VPSPGGEYPHDNVRTEIVALLMQVLQERLSEAIRNLFIPGVVD
jgi:hypothetical protein